MRRLRRTHVHGSDCGHRHSQAEAHEAQWIMELVRQRFRLDIFTPIRIEERETEEIGFPPRETRIIFWAGNESEYQYRIFKPAHLVTLEDLPPWWYKDALILDDYPFCDCCG